MKDDIIFQVIEVLKSIRDQAIDIFFWPIIELNHHPIIKYTLTLIIIIIAILIALLIWKKRNEFRYLET